MIVSVRTLAVASIVGAAVIGARGAAADPEPVFDAAQTRQIETIVRSYLLDHPQVLVDALTAYETARRAEEETTAATARAAFQAAIDDDPAFPVAGNPDGDVTVVEFFDYRCGYCKRVLPTVQELLNTDPQVRYVFVEFPILGEQSRLAARAAQAAWSIAPDRYLALHTALMETNRALSEAHVLELARKAGIDADRLRTAMQDPAIDARLQRNIEMGTAIGVRGTPAFMVDGTLVPGAIDMATMRRLVGEARSG